MGSTRYKTLVTLVIWYFTRCKINTSHLGHGIEHYLKSYKKIEPEHVVRLVGDWRTEVSIQNDKAYFVQIKMINLSICHTYFPLTKQDILTNLLTWLPNYGIGSGPQINCPNGSQTRISWISYEIGNPLFTGQRVLFYPWKSNVVLSEVISIIHSN